MARECGAHPASALIWHASEVRTPPQGTLAAWTTWGRGASSCAQGIAQRRLWVSQKAHQSEGSCLW
eukprot:5059779-Prymnesium_polylepis.1